jgi:hypothetical protein
MNTATELRQELTGIINVLPYHKLEALLVLIRNDEDLEDTITPEEEAIVRQRSAEWEREQDELEAQEQRA